MSWEGPDPERDEDRQYPLVRESCGLIFITLPGHDRGWGISPDEARQLLRELEAVV